MNPASFLKPDFDILESLRTFRFEQGAAMSNAERFANRFTILSSLGKGGTAEAFKAFDHDSGRVIALKVFASASISEPVLNEIWSREVEALKRVEHPGIVRFIDAGRCEETSARFIAIEWIDGIKLEDYLHARGKLSWEVFLDTLGEQILGALQHAAEKNISHRDLSPSNVLVSPSGATSIIDFGQAKVSNLGFGLTVKDFHTEPYCPPEPDTGTYTLTRDPYAFAAICIRAICGQSISNHEELYLRLSEIEAPQGISQLLARALSRDPVTRIGTILEFIQSLRKIQGDAQPPSDLPTLPIRFAPGVAERLREDMIDDSGQSFEETLLTQLNDLVTISPAIEGSQASEARLQLETEGYRFIVDVDSVRGDHFVVVNATRRRFRIEAIFQADRWVPGFRFSSDLPRSTDDRRLAAASIRAVFAGLEEFIQTDRLRKRGESTVVQDWRNLLEALRFLAKTKMPTLRYSNATQEGQRLIVTVENPDDSEEEEFRTISVDNTWVFRGEVESIRGNTCTLVCSRPRFNLERIPTSGTLEIDWQQTRTALQRQSRAVEAIDANENPSARLKQLLIGQETGNPELSFAPIAKFFDDSLDEAKKAVVSRWVAGVDLLVTLGPPGTGKTKLIVELIRQALAANPNCKILLASQTHVALDNALQRLLTADKAVTCVRIGSGTRESDPRVAQSTFEKRSDQLRIQVEQSAREFIQERASQLGVNLSEVELGLRVLDVLGTISKVKEATEEVDRLNEEFQELSAARAAITISTSEQSETKIRIRVVTEELDQASDRRILAESRHSTSIHRLSALGKDGKSLAALSPTELEEWTSLLIANPDSKNIGELMELAEGWRLRFGQSADFNAAIIASSSVVAGTCVGFCREEAASRSTFDVCIIDEAGKATTTELLVPIAQSRQVVLLGDHFQLPAVLDYSINKAELKKRFGLREDQISEQLFEKLSRELSDGNRAELTIQYRMRGEIGQMVSNCFYGGKLLPAPEIAERAFVDLSPAGLDSEITWIDPYPGKWRTYREQKVGMSCANGREAKCIVALLRRIRAHLEKIMPEGNWPSIGVISGYAPQVSQIKAEIRKVTILDQLNVECASVHSFQGREVDICIYSVTRKNPFGHLGMLRDKRHLNVALSRAKDYLIIVGGMDFCRSASLPNSYAPVIEFLEDSALSDVQEWADD